MDQSLNQCHILNTNGYINLLVVAKNKTQIVKIKKKLKTKSFPLVLSHSFGNTLVPNSIKWLKKTFPVISFDDFFLA